MMFGEDFYPVFMKKEKKGFRMCKNNAYWCYGKELTKEICKRYNVTSLEQCSKQFRADINADFREYARVCHLQIRYDFFTERMKQFVKEEDILLCEIQNMTRRELFSLFENVPFDVLIEVAENIFTYEEPLIIDKQDE